MSSTSGAWAYAARGAVPGLPTGQSIAVYDSYADAQRAVDYLADQQFPVQHLAIVGTDLKQIERVTGRLTWGKVLLGGVAGGAWIGLLIGLLFALFTPEDTVRILIFSIVWAAIFGAILAAVGYGFSGGRRDFTSMTATIASRYEVFCHHQHAAQARQLLAQLAMRGTGTVTPEAAGGVSGTPATGGASPGATAGPGPVTPPPPSTATPEPPPPQPDLPGPDLPTPPQEPLPAPTPTPDPGAPQEPPQHPRPPATP
jgi:hypothetical protein